ncbi:hypothetical protein ACOSP7_025172 [Xanthoceras sorbifolium]
MDGIIIRNTVSGLSPNPFTRSSSNRDIKGKAVAIETDQPTTKPHEVVSHGGRVSNDTDDKKQKRVIAKRQIANGQYSQKYRLNQQQYMHHLKIQAKALCADVDIKGPRLKYMDRQKSLLQVENGSLKQKISGYTGELSFKKGDDTQHDELKNEKDSSKQLYGYQQQQVQFNNQNMNYPCGST